MNNKNNIMSIISKKISIDNRNKTITKPFVLEHKTIVVFNSQYSIYENEVRFSNCIFENDLILGSEIDDEAFSILESDLIFKNCVFKKKVILDGVQCKGHLVFNNCSFELQCPNGEDVLSISNAQIGIGLALYQCILKGGINLSCTNIESLGCQFYDSSIVNDLCMINFSKSYFAKELSIKGCYIKCGNLDFENIALSDNQGSLMIGGNSYQYFTHTSEIICKLINSKYDSKLNPNEHSYNLVNFYEHIDYNGVSLLIQNLYDDIDTGLANSLLFLIKQYIQEKKYKTIKFIKSERELDGAYPCGNGTINIDENDNTFVAVYIDGCFYLKNLKVEDEPIIKCESEEYSDVIFENIKKSYLQKYDEAIFTDELCYYNNIRMLRLYTNRDDQYVAIYDSNQGFKVYKWNYIQTTIFNLIHAYVGQGVYFRQSEINTPIINLSSLTAHKTIEFEDCKLYCDINARGIELTDLKFNNIVFESFKEVNEDIETFYNQENEIYRDIYNINGIDLSYSNIKNRLSVNDICIIKSEKNDKEFNIYLSFSTIGSLLELCVFGNRQDGSKKIRLDLSNSNINQIINYLVRWDHVNLKVDNSQINHFKTINRSSHSYVNSDFNFKQVKKIVKSIDDNEGKGNGIVIFLKQMESTFIKDDKYDDFEKTWKFRNKIRIKKKWGYISFIPLMWNSLVVNYGLSTWRLAMWLIVIMTAFDFLVYFRFEENVSFCIVNGCVEFMPVSFNTPIMDQLRPHDIAERLKTFEYSSLVTAYKVISYVLVSVLIASFSGFFRSRNE